MELFFAKDYPGPAFEFLGAAHLIALGIVLLLNLYIASLKNAAPRTKEIVRWLIAGILWANEIAWHIWHLAMGTWTIQTMLPLHLCSILVWTGAIMLMTRNYPIYELAYFMGIGGAMQALITPDLGIYGFPHFRFFQTFISHGLIIAAAIFMTFAEGFRPTWKSIGRVFIYMNIYMVFVFVLNLVIGSNYLFIAHKPETPSLIDLLPPWPTYILFIEALGVIVSLILYLPWALKDWISAKQKPA
jgi:hypothetical integral membrane protein (TIGR02206 family)